MSDSARGGPLGDAYVAVDRARKAVNEAWTLTSEAQEVMRRADVNSLVVERLNDARLRLYSTDEYREVLSLLSWKGRRDG